jgi:hypothetical protein
MVAGSVGVTDIVGAASLLLSEAALEALTDRTGAPRAGAGAEEGS